MNRFYFIALLVFISCNARDNSEIKIEGNLDSNKNEIGKWQYYGSHNKLLEKGLFENGLRVGKWDYYWPIRDSINWIKFQDERNMIRTNIPDFLHLVEIDNKIISFKSKDTSKIFNLVIGRNYSTDFNSYQSSFYQDLKERKITLLDSASQYIETTEAKYLYSHVQGVDTLGNKFYIFNIVGLKDGDLIELSLRCEQANEQIGKIVFFSILPNMFIGQSRFIISNEKIQVLQNL